MTDPNAGCLPTGTSTRGVYTPSSTLPHGRWQGIANGRRFVLNITSVSGGTVIGDFDGHEILAGRWYPATFRLSFLRYVPHVYGDHRYLLQEFTGYLMYFDEEIETKWRLSGIFNGSEPHPPGDPESPHASWYATLSKKESKK